MGYEYGASLVCWVQARQGCITMQQQKQEPRKTGQTQVSYDTEPGRYQSKKQWASEQHFKKNVTWITIFTGYKLALQKNSFYDKIYLRNAELNKSKYTLLLKNISWILIYEGAL